MWRDLPEKERGEYTEDYETEKQEFDKAMKVEDRQRDGQIDSQVVDKIERGENTEDYETEKQEFDKAMKVQYIKIYIIQSHPCRKPGLNFN